MGLLDGGLQRVAFGAFGALLLDGRIIPKRPDQTRDAKGRVKDGDVVPGKACKAFFDQVTDKMREAGYANRDVQILCLQLSPDGSQIPEPQEGDICHLRGVDWRIGTPIDQDGAQAAWTFKGTPA
jgi:hypothetical protein